MEVTVRAIRLAAEEDKRPCVVFHASNAIELTDEIALIKAYQENGGIKSTSETYQRLASNHAGLPDLTQPGYTYFIIKLSAGVYQLTAPIQLDGLCGVKIIGEKQKDSECETFLEGAISSKVYEPSYSDNNFEICIERPPLQKNFPCVYISKASSYQDSNSPYRRITKSLGWVILGVKHDHEGFVEGFTLLRQTKTDVNNIEYLTQGIISQQSILVAHILWLSYKLVITHTTINDNILEVTFDKINDSIIAVAAKGCPTEIWNVLPQSDDKGKDKNQGAFYYINPKKQEGGKEETSNNDNIQIHYLCSNEQEYDTLKADPEKLRVGLLTQFADIRNCIGICLENICFRHGGINDLIGSSHSQAEATSSGCINISQSDHIIIRNCEFAQIGGYAVKADKCTRVQLLENYVHDTYGGGFHLNLCHNCIIDDNLIRDFGNYEEGSVGILLRDAYSNNVTHNTIFNGSYTGISVGWQWGYAPSKSYDNYIAYNHIHHCMRLRLNDGGGIYCLGISPGTIIENNVIHDIVSTTKNNASAIYLDEGSSYIKIRNNVCFGCNVGLHQHYGKANEICNNLFAYTNDSCIKLSQAEQHLSLFAHNNILKVDCGLVFNTAPNAIADFHDNVLDKSDNAIYIPAREYVPPYRMTCHKVDFTYQYVPDSVFLYHLSLAAAYMNGRSIMDNASADFIPFDALPKTQEEETKDGSQVTIDKNTPKTYGVQDTFLKQRAVMADKDVTNQKSCIRAFYKSQNRPYSTFFL